MKANKAGYSSIDEYIATFPRAVQKILQEVREAIRAEAPEAAEKISYQMPTFYYNGNLVHFAAFTSHIGFYPTPSGILAFKDELSRYASAKGSVQFPIDEIMPLELIRAIVRFRVAENAAKARSKKKTPK